MIPITIGISSGLLIILVFSILKQLDKMTVYGLILSGIGFLYVGFVWTDLQTLVVNSTQAVLFLLLAYYGIKKGVHILALGYFLHGCWDVAYNFFSDPGLIPPSYDMFCSSLDFTVGAYILVFNNQFKVNINK
ncbi:hypothetical protein DHD05_06405 [Arenibacter sp. N53]|uniref:DUF6010 family protein n=1 Tax=Arenibacter TaxID=178469 RepID=UPI000CD3F936|nr:MULTISPECIES: DUF6010 family protein [Arenibacter]MCM4151217.1 hypothetical protein [Arenibacter sp. N53]